MPGNPYRPADRKFEKEEEEHLTEEESKRKYSSQKAKETDKPKRNPKAED